MKRYAVASIVSTTALLTSHGLADVLTPEQLANGNGQIPHPVYGQEYYSGPTTLGSTHLGELVGGVYPAQPSLSWYKYVSDGVSPVIFDLTGSTFSFGYGGFGGGPDGELALYNSQGQYVAGNESPETPTTGDSNVPLVYGPNGSALPSGKNLTNQPSDPTKPVASYDPSSNTWYNDNLQGLSQLAFVKNPQANPQGTATDWNQYSILPAGTYFLAVTGYSTYFAGNPRDTAAINQYGPDYGGITPTTPFGWVSFHAMTGDYVLNTRLAGDFNGDGKVDPTDVELLKAEVALLASNQGISPDGFTDGTWTGLPANLQAFDLTDNGRIDQYDLDAFTRDTGIPVPEPTALATLFLGVAAVVRRRRSQNN